MINCRECGSRISEDAKACPQCGKDDPNAFVHRAKLIMAGIMVVVIAGAAFLTNPDQAQLEKRWRESLEEFLDQRERPPKAILDALIELSFERKNYYLFSVGTVKWRRRTAFSTGAKGLLEVVIARLFERLSKNAPQGGEERILGAFGRWWFEWPRDDAKH